MWNKMIEWLNVQDNVTFLIAVASFGLSIWNFVSDKLKNRKKLEIVVQNVFCMGPSPEMEYTEILNLTVINKSREAITLSGLEIKTGTLIGRFGEYRFNLHEHSHKINNREVSRSVWYADVFPIKIEGLGYSHVLLASTGEGKYIHEGEPYTMTIFTNKGPVTKEFVSCFSSGQLLSQCRAPDLQTEALQ